MCKLVVITILIIGSQLSASFGVTGNEFSWSDQTKVIWPMKTNATEQSAAVSFSDWCVFFPNAASGPTGVRFVLNQMAASGIRTVWWRTFGGGWAHYASRVEGVTHGYYPGFGKTYGEFDPLAEAVPYAHKLGLKIYAWYTPLEEAHGWPDNVRSHYVDAHPELADRTSKHATDAPSFFFEEYRQYKLDLGLEMVRRYKTDGLVIDFERRGSPGRNNTWGYLPQIVAGYKEETGIDPLTLSVNDKNWCAYRARYVGLFMKDLHTGIKKLDRSVELAVMVREKQPVSAHWNIPEWIEKGIIDRVILSAYGSEGWGTASDGTKGKGEYRDTNIPVGLQFYAYNPSTKVMIERAANACRLGYDELVWFESTPLNYKKRYNIPRRIAYLDNAQISSPAIDMTGGGQLVVLAAGKWKLWIEDSEKPLATGHSYKAVRVKLPELSGKHQVNIECSLMVDAQAAGIVVQGWVIDSSGKRVNIQSDTSWQSADLKTKVVIVSQPGVPPFLGELENEDGSLVRSAKRKEPVIATNDIHTPIPGTYRAHDPAWQGKWIWGSRKVDAPAYDVNLYDWLVKYPGGWDQTLVNRIVGNAANGGLSKIYWRLDDGRGRLLFPADTKARILRWPNWNLDFGALDMPALALELSQKCGIECILVIDKKWIDIARKRYPDVEIVTPEDIKNISRIKAVDETNAVRIARKWLIHGEYIFRRIFEINSTVKSAEICITGDNSYELYLDGQHLGSNADWWRAETYVIGSLQPGKHVLSVKVNSKKDLGGLLVNMRWQGDDGKTVHLNTDESWKVHFGETASWNLVDCNEDDWMAASIVGINGIGSRFRLKEPWRNIRKPQTEISDDKINVKVANNSNGEENLFDGDLSDTSVWKCKGMPSEIIMELDSPLTISGIRIHSGNLQYYGNPSGASSIKSFSLESFEDGKWMPLSDTVIDLPPYDGAPRDEAVIVHDFSPRKVKKMRLTILDSNDTMRRIHSPDKDCIKPSQKGCFIREIELIKEADAGVVSQIYPRIETVTFHSKILNKKKTYSVVLPKNYDYTKKDWPVLFFFHGRGRHERSLVDDVKARVSLMKAPFVIILPDGDDGWYIDSPVRPDDQYQQYTEEVIRNAESKYNLSLNPAKRGLTGWSMGGYGSVRFAETHPQNFSAVASIIGLLDFPRTGLPEGQSYKVPSNRFGNNPEVWEKLNPINSVNKLKNMEILIVMADKAFDRTMNENFVNALTKAGITYEQKILKGGHAFSVVQNSVPIVIDFMTKHLFKNIINK